MGCVNSTYSPPSSRNRNLERLKRDNAYATPKRCSASASASASAGKPPLSHEDSSRKHSSVSKHAEDTSTNKMGVRGKLIRDEQYNSCKTSSSGGQVDRDHRDIKEKEKEKGVANTNATIDELNSEVGNVSSKSEGIKKKNNIGTYYELVDGWPKWLVDNIPKPVLDGLVPKSAHSYEKLGKVGRGTYSNVYKARDKDTGKIVALKKVRFDTSDSESVKFMAREIMILQKLDHPNVIKLRGLATSRMQYSLYLVFDYMQADLTRIISRPGEELTEPQIKCYMQQLLFGLRHCHEKGVMHRDIKPSNLLIDKRGVLKIADFGLAKIKLQGPFTNRVVTLWYRAPELLLGSTDYGFGIDLWSAGCLLAEMIVRRPFMPGRTEVEQLHMIFKLCGSPSEDYLMKMKLRTTYLPPNHYKANFEDYCRGFPSSSLGLLTTLLHLDPACRGSAASALESEEVYPLNLNFDMTEFFKSAPLACDFSALPVIYKEEDERSQTKRRKRHRRKGQNKELESKTNESNASLTRGRNHTDEQRRTDSEPSKEAKKMEQNMQGQEKGSSGNSTSSQVMEERSMNTSISLSPIFISTGRKSPKTEGHPNALKNVRNYTLLQASIIDMMNRNEATQLGPLRRSFSSLDIRVDLEKLPSLYGPNKNLGFGG